MIAETSPVFEEGVHDWGFGQFMPLADLTEGGYPTFNGTGFFVSVDILVSKATPEEGVSDAAAVTLGGHFGLLLLTGNHSDLELEVSQRK